MKTSLQQTQENLQAYILQANQTIAGQITAVHNDSTLERLNIYRDGYYVRLLEILTNNYPVLKQYVGDAEFEKLGQAYIDSHPSQHFSIRLFGQHFGQFLASQTHIEPMLPELAKFEWILAQTQDAADDVCLSFDTVAQVPPEAWGSMQFTLHPSASLLSFFYNVADLWVAFNQNQTLPALMRQDEPAHWLFWRSGQMPYFALLSEPELYMINAIQAGQNFGAICELLCDWFNDSEVVQFAAGTLRGWVEADVFTAVQFEPVTEMS